MKSLSCFLLLVLGLIACAPEKHSRPDEVISKEKMALILADIHQAEGIISVKNFSKDSSLLLFAEIEQQLYDKHAVTKESFKESYNWYTANAQEYKDLYSIVVDTLSVRTSERRIP